MMPVRLKAVMLLTVYFCMVYLKLVYLSAIYSILAHFSTHVRVQSEVPFSDARPV